MTTPTAGAGSTGPPGHPGTGSPPPPPPPPKDLPSLAELVSLARSTLDGVIHMLGYQWDPRTGPQQDDPWGPEAVDIHFGNAVTDVRSALIELADVAAMIPARQSTNSASLPGGPANHLGEAPPAMCLAWEYGACECSRHCLGDPRRGPEDNPSGSSDEGLTPGLDAGAGIAPEGSDADLGRPLAGSSHLAAYPASGGRTPGLVDAASHPAAGGTDGSGAAAPSRDAGASSDPRPVAHSAGPDGPRREAGVGFALPEAKAFDIRQTIDAAYAKQQRHRNWRRRPW